MQLAPEIQMKLEIQLVFRTYLIFQHFSSGHLLVFYPTTQIDLSQSFKVSYGMYHNKLLYSPVSHVWIQQQKLYTIMIICEYWHVPVIFTRFQTSDGVARSETGVLNNVGTENEAMSVTGDISFTTDDGKKVTIKFVSDENGYRPVVTTS